ncbi:MAG: orotidine-5'-phosphate decarboxylase [Acidobacteria bacterium]|nr:orotidine-5'-phosphate decarboxylase [Acidobacteriota bacterium]
MIDKTRNKIIVALDVATASEAREAIAELREEVGAFKIGLQLFTACGAPFVRELVKDGVKIFLDVKFHDIPVTVAKASVEVARLGVWMFNIHASGGREMIERTVDLVSNTCQREQIEMPKLIGVTVLTSSDEAVLREIGLSRSVDEQVLALAKMAAECGLDGVVASPNETGSISNSIGNDDFLIVTPGVRLGEIENDDQKRFTTPGEAISLGSDYLVIGRPIMSAKDRKQAVKLIVEDIANST